MREYINALKYILEYGEVREDRTGIGTRGVFGYQMRFNLAKGFPAVTTKRLAWKSVVSELLWFLEGSTDERRLAEILYGKSRNELIEKKTIWTANADNQGKKLGYKNTNMRKELGPVYGSQWRKFGYNSVISVNDSKDQIEKLVHDLKENPYSRRHILTAWNPNEVDKMALPPCHLMAQFYVSNGKLSCLMYQRSADMFLGVPFNIASYSLFTHMLCSYLNLTPGDFIHSIGDAHIYNNHMGVVREQIQREPKPKPKLKFPKIESFDIDYIRGLNVNDFILENYNPMSTLKAPMAV